MLVPWEPVIGACIDYLRIGRVGLLSVRSSKRVSAKAVRYSQFFTKVKGKRDEALDVDQEQLEAVVSPIRNTTREMCFNYGFRDFPSKTITITSACEKSNQYYSNFMKDLRRMAKGDRSVFCCTLDYRAAAANGITDMDFFIKEKERMPELTFQMEYGSKFVGANSNSAYLLI